MLLAPTFLVTVELGEETTRFDDETFTYNTVSTSDLTRIDEPYRSGQRLGLDLGVVVAAGLGVNLHAAISTATTAQTVEIENYGPPPNVDKIYPYDYRPLELGIGVTYTFKGFWASPWIGLAQVRIGNFLAPDCDTCLDEALGLGASLGYDVLSLGHHDHVSVFVHGTYSKLRDGGEDGASLRQLGAGIAYRYWSP